MYFFHFSEIIPDLYGRYPMKHTTTKHNAYPTWTENLIFNGKILRLMY